MDGILQLIQVIIIQITQNGKPIESIIYLIYMILFWLLALVTEALIMWTARFGAVDSDGTEKRSNDVAPSRTHLELEIKINGDKNENNAESRFKSSSYNHYNPETSYKRKARKLSHRKVVTVNGDGRLSQKKVLR